MAKRCAVCSDDATVPFDGVCTGCGMSEKVTLCGNGHGLCTSCSDDAAFGRIRRICLGSTSSDPCDIFMQIVGDGVLDIHDPKHPVAVGSALLAAHRNAGTMIDLEAMLDEMERRGRTILPGSCGLMGSCGTAMGVGTFLSILTGTTPLTEDTWGDANLATAQCLIQMALIGGPRCCKRNSFVALKVGARIASEKFGSEMDIPGDPVCPFSEDNTECIRDRCPYHPGD